MLSKMIELTVIQKIEDIAMKQKYRWKIGRENKIVTFLREKMDKQELWNVAQLDISMIA